MGMEMGACGVRQVATKCIPTPLSALSPPLLLCPPRFFFWWKGFNARFLLAAVVAMGKPRGGENCAANASEQDQPPITFN